MAAAEPAHRSVPTNPVIRTATPADVVRLGEIAAAAKAHWGYPPAWLDQWREALTITPADLSRWTVRVATDPSGAAAGFVATSVARPRWEVEHLWVDPPAMGRGIGRVLVRDAFGRANAAGAAGLAILSDPNAAGFYLRLGARPAGALPAPMPGAPERTLPLLWLDTM